MIKLISQFDNEKSKPSLATPTCAFACCCCCCCCLFSTIAVASISARNFGALAEEELPMHNKKKNVKVAKKIAFWQPIGLFVISVTLFFSIGLKNGLTSDGSTSSIILSSILFGSIYIIISTQFLYKMKLVNIASRVVLFTIIWICSFVAEAFIALFSIISGGVLIILYIIVGIVVDIKLVVQAFEKK